MRLQKYFAQVEDSLRSRRGVEIESLTVRVQAPNEMGQVRGRIRFWDGSLLRFDENLIVRGASLIRQRYSYHYQDAAGHLRFRYDNVPHHPDVSTHPHHKHVGDPERDAETIVTSKPPDLGAVLREIDQLLHQ